MSIATVRYDIERPWESVFSDADWINAPPSLETRKKNLLRKVIARFVSIVKIGTNYGVPQQSAPFAGSKSTDPSGSRC